MPTVCELRNQLKEKGIKGYSKLNKAQLEDLLKKNEIIKKEPEVDKEPVVKTIYPVKIEPVKFKFHTLAKDIPDVRERILNIMEVYGYDKKNSNYVKFMWRITSYVEKFYFSTDENPIEGGDVLDWAIGNIDFSNKWW